jgi:hypothetical protein
MITSLLNSSIEMKEKNVLILALEEVSLIRFVQIKYLKTVDVSIQFACQLNGKWVNANRLSIVAHTLPRKVKTGSLPARFVRIEFFYGDLRHLQDVSLIGITRSEVNEMKKQERDLYLERPLEMIY